MGDSDGSDGPSQVHDGGASIVSSHEANTATTSDYSRHHLNRIMTDSVLNTAHKVPTNVRRRITAATEEDEDGGFTAPNSDLSCSALPLPYDRFRKIWNDRKSELKQKSKYDWLSTFIPAFAWLQTYNWRLDLCSDLTAGLTVGIMIIPQSMSYAKLAGLPVEFGLYSALAPVYAYSLFGSSRQLAVGPVALLSLMLSTGLTHIVAPAGGAFTEAQTQEYIMLSIQASLLVGLFYIAMGLLRLGFVTIFLSHAVISGFTSGAAVIIGLSQLKYILGYNIERSDRLVELLHNTVEGVSGFSYKTFLMGMSGVLVLLVMKHCGKTYPKLKWMRAMGPLTVSAVCIMVTWAFGLQNRGIPIVENIPSGLPSVTISQWAPLDMDLMQTVLSMVVVGFMESIAIAKQLAAKHKYELDSSTELLGLGVANFMGAVFNSYPITGSFSRSAVNNDSGAKSGISGVVTATLVMLTLLFLTSIFEFMPLATLAAIVISGVLGLLDYEEAIYLWRVHKFDFLVWMVSFCGTMFLGVEIGLVIAVGLSLLLVLYESAYPHTAVLGRLPGSTVYRNVKQYPEAERYEGIMLCRVDAPIYFANTQYIREKLQKYEKRYEQRSSFPLKFVIVDMSPVSYIDTSALHIMEDIRQDYESRGITLCLSNPSRMVMHRLVLDGLSDKVGHENIFVSTHDAVSAYLRLLSQADVDIEDMGVPTLLKGDHDPEMNLPIEEEEVNDDVLPDQGL